METKQFSEEIGQPRLVENGHLSHEEYELGIESFHHFQIIRYQVSLLQKIAVGFATVAFLLGIILALVLITEKTPSQSAAENQNEKWSSSVVDTIEKIKSENIMLKEKNASLAKEIKLIREQLAKRDEPSANTNTKTNTKASNNNNDGGRGKIKYHEVGPGETLASIAKKYFGDANMAEKIIRDNNLRGASDIHEGRQLKIIL